MLDNLKDIYHEKSLFPKIMIFIVCGGFFNFLEQNLFKLVKIKFDRDGFISLILSILLILYLHYSKPSPDKIKTYKLNWISEIFITILMVIFFIWLIQIVALSDIK